MSISAVDIIAPLERDTARLQKRGRPRKRRISSSSSSSSSDDEQQPRQLVMHEEQAVQQQQVFNPLVLRQNASLYDHLLRLQALLTYCDRVNSGKWIGIQRFIDLYFSTVFHAYFGESFAMSIIHVPKRRRIGAHFILQGDRHYSIIVMLNPTFWDKLLVSGAALPDVYFSPPTRPTDPADRSFVVQAKGCDSDSEDEKIAPATSHDSTALYAISLTALALVHRLEMFMYDDLRTHNCSHVVTLSSFFTNRTNIRNPLDLSYQYD